MKKAQPFASIKVADEVWIATALLHRENPKREDFSVSEIVARARRENLSGELRPGVQVHAYLHCVANVPPNPGRYRMLYATGKNTRRLSSYQTLLDRYQDKFVGKRKSVEKSDPILELRGLGKEIWVGEDADKYVSRLRGGWE